MSQPRCRSARVAAEKVQTERDRDYTAIGIAMVTLIECTVSVTTAQSDNAPIVSEMAMALVSRQEAGRRLPKPAVPGDRIMICILTGARESPSGGTSEPLATFAGNIAAAITRKMAKPRHGPTFCPLFSGFTR